MRRRTPVAPPATGVSRIAGTPRAESEFGGLSSDAGTVLNSARSGKSPAARELGRLEPMRLRSQSFPTPLCGTFRACSFRQELHELCRGCANHRGSGAGYVSAGAQLRARRRALIHSTPNSSADVANNELQHQVSAKPCRAGYTQWLVSCIKDQHDVSAFGNRIVFVRHNGTAINADQNRARRRCCCDRAGKLADRFFLKFVIDVFDIFDGQRTFELGEVDGECTTARARWMHDSCYSNVQCAKCRRYFV